MARQPTTTRKKTVSAANLAALGAERLAGLLIEAAAADAALKRRLRMELAAEVGVADLALEIDKRLTAIGGSRARVSWRKRPALLAELRGLLRMIVDRLGPGDARLALDRLIVWFDLFPGLSARVSDARGELPLLFDAATADLAALASAAGPLIAAPPLAEALATRLNPWASWVGRGAPAMDRALAVRLLKEISGGPKPAGRLALVMRKLADRAGDLDSWLLTIPDEDARKPDLGAEIARRLAVAGRAGDARAALEAARTPAGPARWGRIGKDEPTTEPWARAEIAVLEAEDRNAEADEAHWALFSRTLSADDLRPYLARLADFEDVVALERAFELAAVHPDATRGLAFLMDWPALREAAALVAARPGEIRGGHEATPLWAARLAGRYPSAALLLLRARARALAALGSGAAEELQGVVSEAEALAASLGEGVDVASHADFVAGLAPERRWRG